MASWNTLPNIYCYWALLIKKMNKPQISLIAVVFILFKKFGPTVLCMSVTSHYQMNKINHSWLHFKM